MTQFYTITITITHTPHTQYHKDPKSWYKDLPLSCQCTHKEYREAEAVSVKHTSSQQFPLFNYIVYRLPVETEDKRISIFISGKDLNYNRIESKPDLQQKMVYMSSILLVLLVRSTVVATYLYRDGCSEH